MKPTGALRGARLSLSLVGVLLTAAPLAAEEAPVDCAELQALALHDVVIESAEAVDAEDGTVHCKVKAMIGGRIGVSVWLPDSWNGHFVMGGSGGFVEPEDNQALRLANGVLEQGYATASTDTGHRAHGLDGSWALNDMEAMVNYGHVGTHRAVLAAKAIIDARYSTRPSKSFFFGCSNGGRQALQEAQRYPADFDGIVAGAPAIDFRGIAASFVNVVQHMYPNPQRVETPLISPDDRRLLRGAIEAKCDAADGVTDGVLQDPNACRFDVRSLRCGSAPRGACLNSDQIQAVRAVYDGPRAGRERLFPGFPYGGEDEDANGWGWWFTDGPVEGLEDTVNASFAFGVGLMRYFIYGDPEWSYVDYDWSRYQSDAAAVHAALSPTSPDLDAFRERGGKLLLYHGWADTALTAYMSTDYVKAVVERDASAADDVRLFMMPGVLHCGGGPGPSVVDWLQVLTDWQAGGDAPAELTAGWPNRTGGRRLCAWPRAAVYQGGDADAPASYRCE
ncbi:MAG: tannase/feruloyl esterase family alpha/beta hydrolase [Pseudomonadota bacterium]